MNIIIQALIDAKDTLEIFRNRCSAQEWEKVGAQIAHLQYLAATTEVVAMLPSTVTQGDVLPAADTTLLRTLQVVLPHDEIVMHIQALTEAQEGLRDVIKREPSLRHVYEAVKATRLQLLGEAQEVAPVKVVSHDDPGIGIDSHASPEAQIANITEADKKLSVELRTSLDAEKARSQPETLGHPSEAYFGRDSKHAIRWVPEAPAHQGLYAFEAKDANDKRNCTVNINDALQFMFRQQCIDWCTRHPVPEFVAMEHMFMSDLR